MFVNQKAQEISHALIRVAAYIRRSELKQRIEKLSFQLIEDTASMDLSAINKTVLSLDSLINVGRSIFEIEPTNASILIRELNSLNSAMKQIAELPQGVPNLESLFSRLPVYSSQQTEEHSYPSDENNQNRQYNNPAMRQSAIVERMRQSANRQLQLKDIIAEFPDISERTMRYDLQKLCNQGIIERVGNGGPGSYYVMK